MTNHIIRNAEYQDTGVHAYKDNPFIEALPPIQEPFEDTKNLISKVTPTLDDIKQKRVIRAIIFHSCPLLNSPNPREKRATSIAASA